MCSSWRVLEHMHECCLPDTLQCKCVDMIEQSGRGGGLDYSNGVCGGSSPVMGTVSITRLCRSLMPMMIASKEKEDQLKHAL